MIEGKPVGERRMSFGDHLEELRRCLLKGLLGVLVFFVGGLCFQNDLIALIAIPHERAMGVLEAEASASGSSGYRGPLGWQRFARDQAEVYDLERARRPDPQDPEARERFRRAAARQEAFFAGEGAGATLVATRYPEAFLTGIKAALVLALLLGAPWLIYQLWMFVGAGLYLHERKWVRIFLPLSLVLFLAGAVFGYFVLIPFGLYFLAGFNVEHVSTMITLGDYFSLFLTLTVALGAIFQLPLAMIAVTLLGLIKPQTFAEKRRYFILGAFVIGAVLTPPDPITQLLMAGPILVLYEVGLWGSRAIERATEGARAA